MAYILYFIQKPKECVRYMAMYFTVYVCVHKPPEMFPKDEPIVHTARNISGSAFCTQYIFLRRHRWEFPHTIGIFSFHGDLPKVCRQDVIAMETTAESASSVAMKSESHMTSECDHTHKTTWTQAIYKTLQLSFSEDIIRIQFHV